jgi:hypothetical protein
MDQGNGPLVRCCEHGNEHSGVGEGGVARVLSNWANISSQLKTVWERILSSEWRLWWGQWLWWGVVSHPLQPLRALTPYTLRRRYSTAQRIDSIWEFPREPSAQIMTALQNHPDYDHGHLQGYTWPLTLLSDMLPDIWSTATHGHLCHKKWQSVLPVGKCVQIMKLGPAPHSLSSAPLCATHIKMRPWEGHFAVSVFIP